MSTTYASSAIDDDDAMQSSQPADAVVEAPHRGAAPPPHVQMAAHEEDLLHRRRLFSRGELETLCRASPSEIDDELWKLGAMEVNGYLRVPSFRMLALATDRICQSVVENSWSLLAVPAQELCEYLESDLDPAMVLYVMGRLGRPLLPLESPEPESKSPKVSTGNEDKDERDEHEPTHFALSALAIARVRCEELIRLVRATGGKLPGGAADGTTRDRDTGDEAADAPSIGQQMSGVPVRCSSVYSAAMPCYVTPCHADRHSLVR